MHPNFEQGFDLKDTIIKYFNRKRNIATFLVFVYAFAIGFIFLVNPFNVKSWLDWKDTDDYVLTVLSVVGIGFFVLLASRSLMYILRNKVVLNFKSFLIWIAVELAVLSALYTYFAHEYDPNYMGQGYFDIFPRIFMYVALILLVPYIFSWMYAALKVKRDVEADAVVPTKTTENEDSKSDMSKSISETELLLKEQPDTKHNIVNFSDDKGQLKLSVDIDNLLYIESADNYVNIYYSNKGKFSRFMLRSTLKSIEDTFSDCDLVRCHRSYVVNFKKVKVLRKEKTGLFIDLDFANSPEIPVSKTYAESVIGHFSRHSLLQ
ncbi:MAG: LytTR family transcriptional regulator [Bacteroidales bacterium]|nr:LytTR family transcriptional regulator [Bacteroidales bacterium]